MPVAGSDGIDLYYERRGAGPRLLFLNGSGSTLGDMGPLLELLGSSADLVAWDYRGLGRSGPSPGPYAMSDCARDALAVMDAVGWDTAGVIGVSFGGMVAQELSVTAPHRIERLALLCTSPGGPGGSSYPLHELEALDQEEARRVRRRLIDTRFDDGWLASHPSDRNLVEALERRSPATSPEQRRGHLEQLEARRHHDVWDRLPAIACPTYVACGRFDGIAPPRNSAAIESRIEGARLETYEGGHLFLAQDPRSITEVLGFLGGTDGLPPNVGSDTDPPAPGRRGNP